MTLKFKFLYFWDKHEMKKVRVVSETDLEKKPAIPMQGKQIQQLMQIMDEAHAKRTRLWGKWRKG